ncbi:MAG TPA: hypothetical protein DCE56_01345 [Cyanobacteria bacterium UBA8553]|nr:hypothetical protein [Cyanobacteria bacterium UBA8553]HAJ63316.1 hypothetical protein [Cyanobacteria bacterium UBA8543]
MDKSFLTDATETPTLHISSATTTAPAPSRESVKVLLIGSPRGVNNMIQTLYRLKFAEVTEWSPLQPTAKPGEVISILIRQFSIR